MEQGRYQVRFDWAMEDCAAISDDADVIVWVDAIPTPGAAVPLPDMPSGAAVIGATVADSAAVAAWLVALQHSLARRIVIAVIAAGETRESGAVRFAVEDQLAAGAVIEQLSLLGLDATSPEAGAAQGAYRSLSRAVAHLMTASVTGQTTAPEPYGLRLNSALTVNDVVVHRAHPDVQTSGVA